MSERKILTRPFGDTVCERFNRGLSPVICKSILRDYVNATIGFEGLAAELGKSSKSLQRMLGASGNPTAENLLAILKVLQEHEAVHIKVKVTREAA